MPWFGHRRVRRAPEQTTAGGDVRVAADPTDAVGAGAVQLRAPDLVPPVRATCEPVDAHAVLILRGIVRLAGTEPDRTVRGIGRERPDREPRQPAVDRMPLSALVERTPHTTAGRTQVDDRSGMCQRGDPA